MSTPQKHLPTTVRFEPEVRARLDSWRYAHRRSLNAAVNILATEALDAQGWAVADTAETGHPEPEES